MPVKILVTGGAGFIGSWLALQLQSMELEVKVLDDLRVGVLDNLSGFEGEIIQGDVRNVSSLLMGWSPEIILHQASITDTTVLDRREMFGANVDGFRRLLDYAVRHAAKVVYASSASVYGDGPIPMIESQATRPLNPYAESKVAIERLACQYSREYAITTIGLRYFNVYGPREHHKGKAASMVWQLAQQIAANGRPRLFKWGEQQRDFVYVKDVVQAALSAMKCDTSVISNVGSGSPTSFNALGEFISVTLDKPFHPEYFDNPHGFYQNATLADIDRAKLKLGFQPRYDVKKGVEDYMATVARSLPYSVDQPHRSTLT